MTHKVGAAPGEVLILAARGKGARSVVAVVQTHDNAKPVPAEGGVVVVAAALVVGIGPDFLAEKHPAPAIALTHDVFSTWVVETVKEFGFKG